MNFLAVTWNVDPVLLSIGSLSIRYYSLCFVVAFIISFVLFKKFFKEDGYKLELLDKLTFYYVIPATLIGARLGHCFFYAPKYYLQHPFEIILPFSNGEFVGFQGLASHGAAIGILLSLILYSRKYKISVLWLLDRIGIAVAISGFFVRLGNLMNSEVYGVETNLPWGFIFVRNKEVLPKHPTQIYEALSYLLIFIFLYWLHNKMRSKIKPGVQFGLFLILLFTARFFIEFIKEPQEAFEQGWLLVMGQWLSIPFILLGAIIIYMSQKNKWPEYFVKSNVVEGKGSNQVKNKK